MSVDFSFRCNAHASAPIDVVFGLVSDSMSWKDWCRSSWAGAKISEAFIEKEGDPAPDGTGAVRGFRLDAPAAFASGAFDVVKDEINHYWPPYMIAFRAVHGAAVKGHQAIVILTERDGGTDIGWHVTGSAPEEGNLEHAAHIRESLRSGVEGLLEGLVGASERQASAVGIT